jgi:opacity protein-like surface antigen
MRVGRSSLLSAFFVAWTAAPAVAQWAVTPYLGVNVGGDVETGKGGPGVSVGFLGGGLGFEFDFQRFQHFFKDEDVADIVPDSGADVDTDAMSFMGNVVAPIRIPGVANLRPYGTAGLGVIRAMFDSANDQFDTAQNNLGLNFGGGMMYALNDRVGVRVDLRYFRAFVDSAMNEGGFFKDYGFLRTTFGVAVQFPR